MLTTVTAEDHKTVADITAARNYPYTDNDLVIYELLKFDWTYEYSDDIRVYKAAREHMEKLKKLIVERLPKEDVDFLMGVIDGSFLAAPNKIKERYPHLAIKYHCIAKPRGVVHALVDQVPVETINKALALKTEIFQLCELPSMQMCYDRYIWTAYAPSIMVMRDHAINEDTTRYYGYRPNAEAQRQINAVVEKVRNNMDLLELDQKYKFLLEQNKKSGRPFRITQTQDPDGRRALEVVSWSVRFYVYI